MRKRIVFTGICFIIVLSFSVAYFSPIQHAKKYIPSGESIKILMPSDIEKVNDCEVDLSGEVHITGENPYIVFDNINLNIAGLTINSDGNFRQNTSGRLLIDTGDGFGDGWENWASASIFEDSICFSMKSANVKAIRINVDRDYHLKNLKLYAQAPEMEMVRCFPSLGDSILALIVSVIITIIVFVLDGIFKFSSKICEIISKTYKKTIYFVGGSILLCTLGVVIEYLIGYHIIGLSTTGEYFNRVRYLFICYVLIGSYGFFCLRKFLKSKPEYLFLFLIFMTGSMMIQVSPIGYNSWDESTHYRWASDASYYKEAQISLTDYEVEAYSGVTRVQNSLIQNETQISRFNEIYENFVGYRTKETTIAHRLSGLFMAVVRMFGGTYCQVYLAGRYAILIIYAVVCFFAMKKLNSGKMILAVIALLPTSMFLATNYSYDYWVICFSMLGMAYFLSELQKPEEPVSIRNTLIMSGAFAIASLPKLIYATLLIIPFFMKKKNWTKKERKKYYVICGCVIIALVILFVIVALQKVGGTGDIRGGTDVNPAEQIHYIFSNPLTYAKDLLGFLGYYYLSYKAMPECFVHFAYLGTGVGTPLILGLLIFVTMTDKNKYDTNSSRWFVRIGNLIVFGGSVILIATALYIDYTPVASQFFQGCQPRYLIPLLFPVLSVISFFKPINKLNRTWYNGIVMGIMVGLVYYNTAVLMLTRLM